MLSNPEPLLKLRHYLQAGTKDVEGEGMTYTQFEFTYTHVDHFPDGTPTSYHERWSRMFSGTDCRRDMRQQGYYLQQVEAVTLCADCQGIGRRPHKTNRFKFVVCKACKGKPELSRHTITYADIDQE